MKKILMLVLLLGIVSKGFCWWRSEIIEAPYANFDSDVVTLSSKTVTLMLAADPTIIGSEFYNGTGATLYVADSSSVTSSTFTAAGGWPVATGTSFSPDLPGVFQGTLYGILEPGATDQAQIKIILKKR